MKPWQVIKQYQNNQRNFQGQNLRGGNFKGQDLSGADFSGCDIRGTNFSNAILTGAKFQKVKAGLQKRWVIILLLIAFLLIVLSSLMPFIIAGLVDYIFHAELENQIAGWVGLITIILFCFVTYRQNLVASLGAVAVAVAVAGAGAFAVAFAVTVAFAVAFAVAVAFALFYCYIGYRTLKDETRDPWLRKIVVTFASIGGTSFYNATLTNVDFSEATLKNTNFNQAILTRTCFHKTNKLDLARPGKSILVNPKVRDLLINPSSGEEQNFFKADFRAANLKGANLQGANLKQADLSEASFKYANLSDANLTQVNAVATNFSHAYFTGACLEAWNIDHQTKLDNIDCQYIFLLEHLNEHGSRERRPSSGDFQTDEFTKLFKEVLSTVDLIFRNGVDWKAFLSAMKQVQVQNEDTPLEIESISNKGDGVVVVKVKVSPNADKEKIHQEIIESYQLRLDEVKKEYEALLKDKDNEHQKKIIALLYKHNGDITEIIKTQANSYNVTNVINKLESKAMSNSNDSNKNINARGDVNISDSVVNLADTIGEVNYAIEQIDDGSENKNDQLKSLLKELTEAIKDETELDEEEKADAVNKVKAIAQASKDKDNEGLQKKAKRAVNLLQTLAKGLEPAGKLAKACGKIIPIIRTFLGF